MAKPNYHHLHRKLINFLFNPFTCHSRSGIQNYESSHFAFVFFRLEIKLHQLTVIMCNQLLFSLQFHCSWCLMCHQKFDSHSHRMESQFSGGDLFGQLKVVRHLEQKQWNKVNREMRDVKRLFSIRKEATATKMCRKSEIITKYSSHSRSSSINLHRRLLIRQLIVIHARSSSPVSHYARTVKQWIYFQLNINSGSRDESTEKARVRVKMISLFHQLATELTGKNINQDEMCVRVCLQLFSRILIFPSVSVLLQQLFHSFCVW